MPLISLVAGDPSGDAHAAALVTALARLDPSCRFTGLGGPQMRAAGVELLDELTRTAAIGPFDAAAHLGQFTKARTAFIQQLIDRKPDAVILVDFGDFNLPFIAPAAKRAGCRVLYYISPQIWAWGRFRLHWVARYVDRLLVLFKFEEEFYRRCNIPATWVGHPLIERLEPPMGREAAGRALGLNPARAAVGLLPGSRAGEVRRHLPLLLAAAKRIAWDMPGVQFVVPKAPHLSAELFERCARSGLEVAVCDDRIAACYQAVDAALIASGTSTVEAALYGTPMVVFYRTSWPTYLAVKAVLRVPRIAMVNVMAGRPLVPEFVQHRASPRALARAMVELLRSDERQAQQRQGFALIRDQLGPPGAVDRAATAVLNELQKKVSDPIRA